MKIVLDTNCLLVVVPKKSKFRIVFDKVLKGEVQLVVTTDILLEYEEQLTHFYSKEYATLILNAIINLPGTIEVNPIYFNWLMIVDDVDDNKFIDAYIAGQAACIVTNDKHFSVISHIEFPKVSCIKLEKFIDWINRLQ